MNVIQEIGETYKNIKKYECEIRIYEKGSRLGHRNDFFLVQSKENRKVYVSQVIKENNYDRESYCKIIEQEIQNLINIEHPTLQKFVQYSTNDFDDDENVTLFYEHSSKGPLKNLLANTNLDNTNRQIIAIGIAIALHFLHSKEYVHLDLSPKNILIDENYYPHLIIFGLLKPTKNASISAHKYVSSIYTAPEVSQTGQITEKANVYSFGYIFLQIVTNSLEQ